MFENEFVLDQKLVKEFVYDYLCRWTKLWGWLMPMMSILLYVIRGQWIWLGNAVIFLLLGFFQPRSAYISIKEYKKQCHGGQFGKVMVVCGDQIEITEGNTQTQYAYTKVKKVYQTEHLIILNIKSKKNVLFRDVILAKDGFTKGNAAEFVDFIQRKCKG